MADRPLPLRNIAWREVCPWLLVLRSVELTLEIRKLLLGAAAMLLLVWGWNWLGRMLLPAGTAEPIRALPEDFPRFLGVYGTWLTAGCGWKWLDPAVQSAGWGTLFYWLLGGFWTWLVSAWAGGILLRSAALQIAADDPAPFGESCRYVLGNLLSYLAAPAAAVVFAMLAAAPAAILGLLMRTTWGAGLGAAVWPLAMLAGTAIAVLTTTLVLGLPWMWAKISTDRGDGFEGFATAFSFLTQRPLYLAWCVTLAILIGWLSTQFAAAFFHFADFASQGAAAWGSGAARIRELLPAGAAPSPFGLPSPDPLPPAGPASGLFGFWHGLWNTAVAGFAFSYFWTAVATIFFVLRYDLESVELDRVHRDAKDPVRPLPPLAPAPERIPVVSITPKPVPPKDSSPSSAAPASPPAGDASAPEPTGGAHQLKLVSGEEPSEGVPPAP